MAVDKITQVRWAEEDELEARGLLRRAADESPGEIRVTDPDTGGQKGQKIERFDLIPFASLEELARVYGVGAQKYEEDNWRKGVRWRLLLGALFRHVTRWASGESRDPETGLHHLAHAAWHCLALMEYERTATGTDDIYERRSA